MSREQYAWVWVAVGLFVCNYAFWSWLNPVMGFKESPIPLVDHRSVCAAVFGFTVSGFGLVLQYWIARRYSKNLKARPWHERLPPIPGFVTSPPPSSADGKLIQTLNAALFLGFPFLAMVHFAYAIFRNGRTYAKPLEGEDQVWSQLGGPLVGFSGEEGVGFSFWDDNFRIGNADYRESITWSPVLQPILMALLFVLVAVLLVRFFTGRARW